MKYLFVGDVHNHLYIFDDIERLDGEYNLDKIIFMGDYVDDWHTTNHDTLKTLEKVFTLKQSNSDKYVLLLGNHELSYLGFPCSGHCYELDNIVTQKLMENINLIEYYYIAQIDNKEYYCTHAGLLNLFIDNYLGGIKQYKEKLGSINNDKLTNLQILNKVNIKRGGRDLCGSFVWADLYEHYYQSMSEDFIIPYQIFGHSSVSSITNLGNGKNSNIFCIDTHSTKSNNEPFGDKSYLLYNDNKFEVIY